MDIERNARSQVLIREVNQRISEIQGRWSGSPPTFHVVCECGEDCIEQIEMTPQAYAEVRAHATYFAVVPGHHSPEVDRLVEDRGSWLLVEAVGVAADIARNGLVS